MNRDPQAKPGDTYTYQGVTYQARKDAGHVVWDIVPTDTSTTSTRRAQLPGDIMYDCNVTFQSSCLYWYGEQGRRSQGANHVSNRVKLLDIQQHNILNSASGGHMAYILVTQGTQLGQRKITTHETGNHGNKTVHSRGYNHGYSYTPVGWELGFKHMTGDDLPNNTLVSYQGTFTHTGLFGLSTVATVYENGLYPAHLRACAKTNNSAEPWAIGHNDLFTACTGTSDPGKGGAIMYVWPRDELKQIMDELHAHTSKDCYKFNDPINGQYNNHWLKL